MLVHHYPSLLEPTLPIMLFRTLLVLICAGAIGYERDAHGSAAGFRTHILVCLGAMLAMTTGQYALMLYPDAVEPTRIGAQVVSGIGFLGAGSIIVTRDNRVSGLTTAAGLWASACIGLAIGIGFYEGAIIGAIAVFITEQWLLQISLRIKEKREARLAEQEKAGKTTPEEEQSGASD